MRTPPPYHPGGLAAATPRRSWPQRIVLALGVVTVIGCLAASGYVGMQSAQLDRFERTDVALDDVRDDQPQNWLVVGSDTRDVIDRNDPNAKGFIDGGAENIGRRSDTIMVVRIDPNGEHLDILSLQRDLWVPIAGTTGSDRINSAYSQSDGRQRLIDTVRRNFDIEINHYVEINFQSFKGIVDAVGGLPLYFDKPLRDRHTGLLIDHPGCVRLDGNQALAFARSRYLQYQENGRWLDDGSSDLGRISRQQYFMRRMFDRAASAAKNPKTMSDLIGVANQFVGLDNEIDVGQAALMMERFGKFQGDAIRSYTLPVKPVTKAGGAEVLEVVPGREATSVLNPFRGFAPEDLDPAQVAVTIRNGSGRSGQDEQVAAAFQAVGYQVRAEGTAPTAARTVVLHGFGGQDAARQIERHLTAGADVRADESLPPGAVVLVTGSDFTTVMRRPRPYVPPPLPPVPLDGLGDATTTTSTTTSGRSGRKASTSTTSTTAPPHNDGSASIGVVPGQPPPGVDCS